jgi:Domain of unknown function (DUF4136)
MNNMIQYSNKKTNLLSLKYKGFPGIYFLIFHILLAGCGSSSQVYSDYDRSANIEEYRTFGWLPSDQIEARNNPLYYNELNDKRIKNAVAAQLESKGYRYKISKPEILLHYHIIIEDKTTVRTDPYGYYYGPYWMRTHVDVFQYREGTLIVDLMDAATNSLVWRGWVTSFIKNTNPEKTEENIQQAVRMIFSKYPYMANKKII